MCSWIGELQFFQAAAGSQHCSSASAPRGDISWFTYRKAKRLRLDWCLSGLTALQPSLREPAPGLCSSCAGCCVVVHAPAESCRLWLAGSAPPPRKSVPKKVAEATDRGRPQTGSLHQVPGGSAQPLLAWHSGAAGSSGPAPLVGGYSSGRGLQLAAALLQSRPAEQD